MKYPYIIVEQFCDSEVADVHPFQTVEKAADYMFASHKDDEIGFVREVNVTARGEPYFLDRTSDFITAWKKIEAEELTEEWNELPEGRENDHFISRGRLDNYLFCNSTGPAMRPRVLILEAAQ